MCIRRRWVAKNRIKGGQIPSGQRNILTSTINANWYITNSCLKQWFTFTALHILVMQKLPQMHHSLTATNTYDAQTATNACFTNCHKVFVMHKLLPIGTSLTATNPYDALTMLPTPVLQLRMPVLLLRRYAAAGSDCSFCWTLDLWHLVVNQTRNIQGKGFHTGKGFSTDPPLGHL